jgi:methylamine utilization protein MauE
MTNVIAVIGGLLGAIFAWSGFSKLRRPTAAALAISQFGVLRGVHRRAGLALGLAELALALLVVCRPMLWQSQALAALGLAIFTGLIGRSLASGHSFACACFGAESETLSIRTFARTAALLVMAVIGAVAAWLNSTTQSLSNQVVAVCAGILLVCGVAIANELRVTQPFRVRTGADV